MAAPATPNSRPLRRRAWRWLALAALLWLLMPAWSPPRGGPDPIVLHRTVRIHGLDQHLLYRGADRRAPALLFLHGGPGVAVPFLTPKLHAALEERFVVVQWDQPGAGRSCGVPPPTDIEVIRDDALTVIDAIRAELGVDRVLLMGASFGSLVGLPIAAEQPDRVAGWIGESQVLNLTAAEAMGLAWARAQGEPLEGLSAPLTDPADVGTLRAALRRHGGLLHRPSALLPLVPRLLFGPEHTLWDRLRAPVCVARSSASLNPSMREERLDESIKALPVPALFVQGRYDQIAPVGLVEPLAQRLGAELVVVEAGHIPSLEAPEAWSRAVLDWAARQGLDHR